MSKIEVTKVQSEDLTGLSDQEFQRLLAETLTVVAEDRKQNALLYYEMKNPQARLVHESKASLIGVGGGNGCIPLEAPVLMADGSWRPLGEIRVGDRVIAADPETGEGTPSEVTTVWRSGVKPVYRVHFSDGGHFDATADHHVPLYLGSGRMTSKGNPEVPHKRPLGDYIESIQRRGHANPSKRISAVSPSEIQFDRSEFPIHHPCPIGGTSRAIDYRRRVCRSVELLGEMECGDIEVDHPAHCYVTGDYVIVSNSGKSETALVEMLVRATGIVPKSLQGMWPLSKFRGPINCRVICESLTNTLEQIILPKLQYWKWTGVGDPRKEPGKGHWGWIPKTSLIEGSWDKSWKVKTRSLSIVCRDPETGKKLGISTIGFMSHDQDPSDFASGDFQFVLMDEPPRLAIFRENQARVMRANGTLMLAMTWPDDPEIPVDWIYDEIYDKGIPGPSKADDIDWFELQTTDNTSLDQRSVAKMAEKWSPEMRAVRLQGKPIRFKNLVHPLFTDTERTWCFSCNTTSYVDNGKCCMCNGVDVSAYCHVDDFEPQRLPTVFLLDPHPRKPHMFLWVQIDSFDDWWVIAEGALDGDCVDVRTYVDEVEGSLGLHVAQRLMDPNMGASPSNAKRDGITWQDEFRNAGLACDLADDSGVGRKRLDSLLRPDARTRRPRITFERTRCRASIQQIKRYVWDDYRASLERDQKQKPKSKNDDYPTLLKYLANSEPTYTFLSRGPRIVRRWGAENGRSLSV